VNTILSVYWSKPNSFSSSARIGARYSALTLSTLGPDLVLDLASAV